MSPPRFQRHLAAVVAALSDIAYPELTVEAGERTRPAPHIAVHIIPGGVRDGTAARPYDDAGVPIQATCTGHTWEVAAHLWDLVEQRLLDGVVDVDDRARLFPVAPHGGGQVRPDYTVNPTVWTATPRYLISTTPD